MTITKISSLVAMSLASVSLTFAMDMMDHVATSTINDGMKTEMKDTMKGGMTGTAPYETINAMSSKGDVTKLQMMLAEKGYLTMPHGASYGYYGAMTKKAFSKYKKASMMKQDTMMMHTKATGNNATMQSTGTMMNH